MTARAEVLAAVSRVCARCDGPLVVTRDAIGRERLRCPRCDGVSRVQPHPDEVLLPQGLVRAAQLPPIRAGEIRCQGCAQGVAPRVRFCARCRAARFEATRNGGAAHPCVTCGAAMAFRRGRPQSNCEACR